MAINSTKSDVNDSGMPNDTARLMMRGGLVVSYRTERDWDSEETYRARWIEFPWGLQEFEEEIDTEIDLLAFWRRSSNLVKDLEFSRISSDSDC